MPIDISGRWLFGAEIQGSCKPDGSNQSQHGEKHSPTTGYLLSMAPDISQSVFHRRPSLPPLYV